MTKKIDLSFIFFYNKNSNKEKRRERIVRTKKIIFLLLLLVSISFTAGCLGGLFNNKPIIESTPGTTAKVGMEYTYEIVSTDPDANDVLTYSLTEKPTGMTINETTGAVSWTPTESQIGENQVAIEVSDGKVSVSQTFTITVAEALLSSIEVVPSEMSLLIGSSETIESITAHYDNETTAVIEIDSADIISYSSDAEKIATISDLGVVTGVDRGTAVITVSYTEGEIIVTDTIDVTVPANLSYIIVTPEFMIIYEGNSQSITSIKAYYVGSTTPVDIALNEVSYISNSPVIVTVNSSGLITGQSASTDIATITVSYTEGSITKTDTIYVTVEELPAILDSISAFPSPMTLVEGESENIVTIRVYYSNGSSVDIEGADLTSENIRYDSSNELVAAVDTSGVVTGISAGTAIIAVSYTEAGITKTDMVAVTVI
jgi:uncharacterized protein YjdB